MTAAMLEDPEGRALVAEIHKRKARRQRAQRARAYGRRVLGRVAVIVLAAALLGLTALIYRHTWEWFEASLSGIWAAMFAAGQLRPWLEKQGLQ